MNTKAICRPVLIGLLILLMAAPPAAFGQGSGASPTFSQEELAQMLAPIALYPDSLLAQVLVAATYPLEVVQADRWVKQNKNLKGEQLNTELDKMTWDLSVKALVPFPQVLGMMSDKLDWTQKVGDAFLAQQAQVMDTIQTLRSKAQAQGSLKTTQEQKVIVEEKTIVIEPTNPTVVYVPSYNPAVVYGAWAYPAYPPYPYYPYGAALTGAAFGFAAGIAVGAAWNNGWGSWNWGNHDMNVNVNRNANINRNQVSHYQSGKWQHDAARRGGVAYRDGATRERYGQRGTGSAASRQDFRGRTPAGGQGMRDTSRPGGAQLDNRMSQRPSQQPSTRPSADSTRQNLQQRQGAQQRQSMQQRQSSNAFQGMGSGSDARMSSDRGRSSRDFSSGGSRGQSFGGSRGGGGGGGFQGGGGRGGGGGGGRGGGGRR